MVYKVTTVSFPYVLPVWHSIFNLLYVKGPIVDCKAGLGKLRCFWVLKTTLY